MDNFITFEDLPVASGLGIRPDDLSRRVIVGAKGSGKTVYLRRLRAAASQNASVYADIVQQDLPATSNIVKFCQCFGKHDLTEEWMQLWYCAIMRSLVTHLLHSKQLSPHLSTAQREELEDYIPEIVPKRRREVSVYSQVTEIINSFHSAQSYSKYFDSPAWAELASTINDVIASMPPIYFFIDSAERSAATLEREPDLRGLGELPGPVAELLERSLVKDPSRRLPSLSVAMELLDQVGSVS